MTLSKFQRLLKKIHPSLRVRQRNVNDQAGIFVGLSGKGGYICRLTQGELNLGGYRIHIKKTMDFTGNPVLSVIKKRGRKTVINLLRNYRWIKTRKQISMLLWGIEYDK